MSLAPSLISIYDRAVATSSGGEAEAEPAAGWYGGCAEMRGVAATAADAEAGRGDADDIDRPPTSRTSCSRRGSTVVKRATSSPAAMALPGDRRPEVDMKKRPLSIRSTSSNASTVSATQRRRRKKQAVGDGVALGSGGGREERNAGDGDDLPALSEWLSKQAASYSDELNSLTSSLLERSESESSGCGRGDGGVARLSSLLTDDDEVDVDVSPSSDCSDAGGLRRGHDGTSPSRHSPSTSESYVDLVVAEILDTERSYVKDLRDVVQVSAGKSLSNIYDHPISPKHFHRTTLCSQSCASLSRNGSSDMRSYNGVHLVVDEDSYPRVNWN